MSIVSSPLGMENTVNETIKLMINDATKALPNAYSPYSNYTVGACLCTDDDLLFTGVNVENSSYGLTVCAEASAIAQMVAAGKYKIKSMVILAGDKALCPPCGACRQRLHEFSTPSTRIYLCDHQSILKEVSLDDLLPMAFGSK